MAYPLSPVGDILGVLRSDDPSDEFDSLQCSPVWAASDGTTLVSSFAAAMDALRSKVLSSDILGVDSIEHPQTRDRVLLFLDPPRHDQIRRIIGHRMACAQSIEALCDRFLDPLTRDAGDLVQDAILPIALSVTAEAIGLPDPGPAALIPAARASSDLFDPLLASTATSRGVAAGARNMFLVQRLLRHSEIRPGPVRSLIEASERGELDFDMVLANIVSLISAGLDTTQGLASNAIAALVARPDLLQRLERQPQALSSYVDEIARVDSPVQLLTRRLVGPANAPSLAGVPDGAVVAILVGCANRDRTVFPSGPSIDIGRSGPRHLGFGAGPHACIGAQIGARVASAVVLSFVARHRQLVVDLGGAQRRPHAVFRSYDTLPVVPR